MRNRYPVLDELDRKILDRYQRDTRLPAQQIGKSIGLSVAAVQRRLKRMRETGVISAEVACVAPSAVGQPLTCIVTVDLEREKAVDLERFRRRILAHDRVQQCYYVTGQADFLLVVFARDMADYEDFTRHVFLNDGNVKSFTTHVVLERVRVGMMTPIAAPDSTS